MLSWGNYEQDAKGSQINLHLRGAGSPNRILGVIPAHRTIMRVSKPPTSLLSSNLPSSHLRNQLGPTLAPVTCFRSRGCSMSPSKALPEPLIWPLNQLLLITEFKDPSWQYL